MPSLSVLCACYFKTVIATSKQRFPPGKQLHSLIYSYFLAPWLVIILNFPRGYHGSFLCFSSDKTWYFSSLLFVDINYIFDKQTSYHSIYLMFIQIIFCLTKKKQETTYYVLLANTISYFLIALKEHLLYIIFHKKIRISESAWRKWSICFPRKSNINGRHLIDF